MIDQESTTSRNTKTPIILGGIQIQDQNQLTIINIGTLRSFRDQEIDSSSNIPTQV